MQKRANLVGQNISLSLQNRLGYRRERTFQNFRRPVNPLTLEQSAELCLRRTSRSSIPRHIPLACSGTNSALANSGLASGKLRRVRSRQHRNRYQPKTHFHFHLVDMHILLIIHINKLRIKKLLEVSQNFILECPAYFKDVLKT